MACLQTRNMKWNLIVIKEKLGFIYCDHVARIFLSEKNVERDGAHIVAPDLLWVPQEKALTERQRHKNGVFPALCRRVIIPAYGDFVKSQTFIKRDGSRV
ncbi:hypothetical protein PEC302107_05460 [Pectobacterium araliae]|nr:hypothetical protein PEC302107_05460 [Pectobacterium carotovorum subsp. carotovorum]